MSSCVADCPPGPVPPDSDSGVSGPSLPAALGLRLLLPLGPAMPLLVPLPLPLLLPPGARAGPVGSGGSGPAGCSRGGLLKRGGSTDAPRLRLASVEALRDAPREALLHRECGGG